MLIISIPKSASTSLLDTFGKLHALPSRQLDFKNNQADERFPQLSRYHNDACKLSRGDLSILMDNRKLYKQHILPTEQHVALLKNVKKVILLRNPYDILLSYRRGTIKGIHREKNGFKVSFTEGEWVEKAERNGFLDELRNFYDGWAQHEDEHTLLLGYKELTHEPQKTINEIEKFYGLPVTKRKINLSKKRYSRHPKIIEIHRNFRRKLMRFIAKHNYYEPLKNCQTYLRNHGIKWV
ncbi:sulfotransferase domain-containing protein [Catalinimonas sp. 4WD22]|uniref:sulfotransferase domain-containing protein n=1 Tax=Catalinimonas locisalis TaxID=3133978 RepID=UPI003100FDDC